MLDSLQSLKLYHGHAALWAPQEETAWFLIIITTLMTLLYWAHYVVICILKKTVSLYSWVIRLGLGNWNSTPTVPHPGEESRAFQCQTQCSQLPPGGLAHRPASSMCSRKLCGKNTLWAVTEASCLDSCNIVASLALRTTKMKPLHLPAGALNSQHPKPTTKQLSLSDKRTDSIQVAQLGEINAFQRPPLFTVTFGIQNPICHSFSLYRWSHVLWEKEVLKKSPKHEI